MVEQKATKCKDLENSLCLSILQKPRRLVLMNTVKVWTKPFDKDIVGVTHGLTQPSQQKPEIEMQLYQRRRCQLELKRREKAGWSEGELSDFLDSTGVDHIAICL